MTLESNSEMWASSSGRLGNKKVTSGYIGVMLGYTQERLGTQPQYLDWSEHKLDWRVNNLETILHALAREYMVTWREIQVIRVEDSMLENIPETIHLHQIAQRVKIQVRLGSYPIPFQDSILIHMLEWLLRPMESFLESFQLRVKRLPQRTFLHRPSYQLQHS